MRRRQPLADRRPDSNVNSLQRGLEALRCFRAGDEVLSATEIARRLAIPKPTALRLLTTLDAAGFLRRLHGGEEFSLYGECLFVGQAFLSSSALARKARPVLQAFADRFNVHVLLCLPEQRGMLILLYLYGKALKPLQFGSGHVLPVGSTAIWHAWLWRQGIATQGKWLSHLRELEPAQVAKVYQSFHDLENSGVCFSSGSPSKDASILATPLSLQDGSPGAIGCLQTAGPWTSRPSHLEISVALRETAEGIHDVLQRT